MLNTSLLQSYMTNFFGYGDLTADTWFIGMEEGGGTTEREIAQRLARWQVLGGKTVVDNARFHQAVQDKQGRSLSYLFEGRVKIQRTWAGLIRIFLALQGQMDDSAEAVRRVQAGAWGRSDAGNCLLELLPLPSPGVNRWNYDRWSSLPELRSREVYKTTLTAKRAARLRDLILLWGV